MRSKVCTQCKQSKPLSEYYMIKADEEHKRRSRSMCKDCYKKKVNNKYECRVCKQIKQGKEFYQRSDGSKVTECKECTRKRLKKYTHGPCERCGAEHYKEGGKKMCSDCRKEMNGSMRSKDSAKCDVCIFLRSCERRVRQTDEEHWDWMPYCFVSSPYHQAYVKVYGNGHKHDENILEAYA